MKVIVKNYIKTAFSSKDAEVLYKLLEDAVHKHEQINIDFNGIEFYTTLFFGSAITCFVSELGPDEFASRISVSNLSELGKTAYQHSLDFAREEYLLTPEQKEDRLRALELIHAED